nr:hypothetical protein [Tanacetum cinerariifolium]
STPIDTKKPLLKDLDGEDMDVHTYGSMIGSLMYLTSLRPAIMVGNRFSRVDTPLFDGMLVPQQAQDVADAAENEDDVDEVFDEPTPSSPTPASPPPPPQPEHIPSPPQVETAQPSPLPQQ